MAIFEDRFIKGSRFTQHFTLDDPSDQVVPKAGTDTVPGALALNLGNSLPGDTTNATDALTAAGFNAMANAVDTTDPFCGNAIQQAVTVAVGQSIACDAAAQEAIACAIASNPEAVACLQAVLCGSTTSGKYYVATSSTTDYDGNFGLTRNCYVVNNGVSTLLGPSGSSVYLELQEVNKDKPVAYYRDGGNLNYDFNISQITMTDTGATETLYDVAEGFGRIFYDNVTKSLYAQAAAGLLKLTLNSAGLITGKSTVSGTSGLTLLYAAHGKALMSTVSGGRADTAVDLTTSAVTTITSTGGYSGANYRVLDISPDGTKWAHSGQIDGYGDTVLVRTMASGSLVCTTNTDKPIDSFLNGGAFFTQDSNHIVVNGVRRMPGSVGYPNTGAGHLLYSAVTGALIKNSIKMYSTFTSSGGDLAYHTQHYAENNAICTVSVETGGIGQVRILENKNDVWQEVAMLPGVYNRAGFYLVSA
jgi:hypothetical protein